MSMPLFVLGAADPEMQAIESLLEKVGISYAYAVEGDGQRVHPGSAYKAVGAVTPDGTRPGLDWDTIVVLVECDGGPLRDSLGVTFDEVRSGHPGREFRVIDHHRPGDPGYGKPPAEFFSASSLGQVLKHLQDSGLVGPFVASVVGDRYDDNGIFFAGEVSDYIDAVKVAEKFRDAHNWAYGGDLYITARCTHVPGCEGEINITLLSTIAAADHCLAAAYQKECPGVDPYFLMKWRAKSRAEFQGRSVNDVLDDIEAARTVLRESRTEAGYADLRGKNVPELPEAAAREGIPFIATVRDRDGREKVVLQAAPAELVQRFLNGDLIPGLTNYYGDPARGFAGGYVS